MINKIKSREGDIVLYIKQDNKNKAIVVESVDDEEDILSEIVEYSQDEILEMDFKDIVAENIAENIYDYLEFKEGEPDLADILKKSSDFGVTTKSGKEIWFNMRITQDASPDENARFVLVMQPREFVRSAATGLAILDDVRKSKVVDETTGLGNRESFIKEADVVNYYISDGKISTASIAVLHIDSFAEHIKEYGQGTGNGLLKEVVMRMQQTFRESDILGYMGEGEFALVLLGANKENAKTALNRLRWQVAHQPLFVPGNDSVTATLSIAYEEIKEKSQIEGILQKCKNTLTANNESQDQLLEAA